MNDEESKEVDATLLQQCTCEGVAYAGPCLPTCAILLAGRPLTDDEQVLHEREKGERKVARLVELMSEPGAIFGRSELLAALRRVRDHYPEYQIDVVQQPDTRLHLIVQRNVTHYLSHMKHDVPVALREAADRVEFVETRPRVFVVKNRHGVVNV